MPIDPADVLPLETAIAEVVADCLEALISEIEDAAFRDRLVDLPAMLRTALLGGPASREAGRTARQRLGDLEVAAARRGQSLAAEAETFRDALALIRDDVD
jgi:hypothetical protein